MNIFNKLFNKVPKANQEVVIGMVALEQNSIKEHLIAIARLNFIKPETLAREAKNNKANAEYLLKMIESIEKDQNESKRS
jgi:hypothetical protein